MSCPSSFLQCKLIFASKQYVSVIRSQNISHIETESHNLRFRDKMASLDLLLFFNRIHYGYFSRLFSGIPSASCQPYGIKSRGTVAGLARSGTFWCKVECIGLRGRSFVISLTCALPLALRFNITEHHSSPGCQPCGTKSRGIVAGLVRSGTFWCKVECVSSRVCRSLTC